MFCDTTAVKYQCSEWGIVAQNCTRNLELRVRPFFVFQRWLFLSGKGTRNPHQALSITASLFLSFVRNADKLSIHRKCSSDLIGCCVPMWLLPANRRAGTFGAVWGRSMAPLHHCSNRLPWQHTRPLPHCFSVYVGVRVCGTSLWVFVSVLNVYRHRVPTGLENHWKFVHLMEK